MFRAKCSVFVEAGKPIAEIRAQLELPDQTIENWRNHRPLGTDRDDRLSQA